MRSRLCAAALAASICGGPALAGAHGLIIPDGNAMKWEPAPPNLPKGMMWSKLQGDALTDGPFTARLTVPAGTLVAPHLISRDEAITVISGDLFHGHGPTLDMSKGAAVHTGGFVLVPAHSVHSVWTASEPAVIEVTGTRIAKRVPAEAHLPKVLPAGTAMDWQPAPSDLPKGMMWTTLRGDPAKDGPFTIRLTLPAGTVIAPHTHAKDESLTVISGDVFHGGDKTIDGFKGTELHTGGIVFLPANQVQSLWTTSTPAVIQVSGTGPFGVRYVDPKDDPSRRKS